MDLCKTPSQEHWNFYVNLKCLTSWEIEKKFIYLGCACLLGEQIKFNSACFRHVRLRSLVEWIMRKKSRKELRWFLYLIGFQLTSRLEWVCYCGLHVCHSIAISRSHILVIEMINFLPERKRKLGNFIVGLILVSVDKSGFHLSVESITLVSRYNATCTQLTSKACASLSFNHQSWLARICFPAFCGSNMYLLRVLIGSQDFLCP